MSISIAKERWFYSMLMSKIEVSSLVSKGCISTPVGLIEVQFTAHVQAITAENPPTPFSEISLEEFRPGAALFNDEAGAPADIPFKNTTITARDGYQIPIRIFNSEKADNCPVFFWYPGCGYVMPMFEGNAVIASYIAQHSGIKVITVDHRLAPESPLPISIYDAYDATKYVATHAAEFGIDPNKIILGGFSSGAHCATVISNLALQTNDFAVDYQILLNGAYDFKRHNRDYRKYEEQDVLCSEEALEYLFGNFDLTEQQFSEPLYAPMFANLEHLPSTMIIVAEYDRTRSEGELYHKKLVAAGVSAERVLLSGQTHNTVLFRTSVSSDVDAVDVIANKLKKLI